MKKKKLVICLVIIVVLIGVGAVAAREIISPEINNWLKAAKKTKPGLSKTVMAIVDGEEIYQENIDAAIIGEEITEKNTGKAESIDSKKVLEEQIRKVVIFHEAVKLGLKADYETAKSEVKESFRLVMEENGENAALLRKYMQEMQFTEAEYLEAATKDRQDSLTRGNLYIRFTEGIKGSDQEKKAAYEKYVDDLVANADIQILTK